MIRLALIGNLGAEAKVVDWNGKKIINFPLAHNHKQKNANGEINENTTWYDCTLYGHERLLSYLKKGKRVYVEGEPSFKQYDKRNGEKGLSFRLKISNIDLI